MFKQAVTLWISSPDWLWDTPMIPAAVLPLQTVQKHVPSCCNEVGTAGDQLRSGRVQLIHLQAWAVGFGICFRRLGLGTTSAMGSLSDSVSL